MRLSLKLLKICGSSGGAYCCSGGDWIDWLVWQNVSLEDVSVWLTDHVLVHALSNSRKIDGEHIPVEYWKTLSALLDASDLYLGTEDTTRYLQYE